MKKICALLLALCMLVALSPRASGAYRIGDIVFTAFNDNLSRNLSDENMPVIINWQAYIPYRELWRFPLVKYSFNDAQRVLMIYNLNDVIYFDLANDVSYNARHQELSLKAMWRYGTVFVPISLICELFGAYYSLEMGGAQGPVVRVSQTPFQTSGKAFLEANTNTMKAIVQQYEQSKPTSPGTGTPQPPVTPDPDGGVSQPPPAHAPKIVYPMVEGDLNEHTEAILDGFARAGCTGTFFVTADSARTHPDLLRRICIGGHALGILISEREAENGLLEEIERANDLLKTLTRAKTRLVRYLPGSDKLSTEQIDAVVAGGYRLWDPTIDTTSQSSANRMLTQARTALSKNSLSASLRLASDSNSAQICYELLRFIKGRDDIVYPIMVWDTPVNRSGALG